MRQGESKSEVRRREASRVARVVYAERQERLRVVTDEEKEQAESAYQEHRQLCRANKMAPASRAVFTLEWLEVRQCGFSEPETLDASCGPQWDYRRQWESAINVDDD